MSPCAELTYSQFISFLFPIIFAIPVFDVLGLPFGTSLAANWMWWCVLFTEFPSQLIGLRFTPSLSYVGQGEKGRCTPADSSGIIMGFPVTLSMNFGMLVGWAVLSPISKHMGWAPGPVSSTTVGARGWIVSGHTFSAPILTLRSSG